MFTRWAAKCINMISRSYASMPLKLVRKNGEIVESHEILDLLERPNPRMAWSFYAQAQAAFLLMTGNQYNEGVEIKGEKIAELWPLRPDRTKIVPGTNGFPQRYEYSVEGSSRKVAWPVDQVTGDSLLLHVREFSPLDDWYGTGRLETCMKSIDLNSAIRTHNKALLDNGARPDGALILKPQNVDGEMHYAPAEIIDEAEKNLEERHQGPKNAGKPMVLSGHMVWEQWGLSPADMNFDMLKDDTAIEVCHSFDVPHVLVVKGEATYSNRESALVEFYERCVIPFGRAQLGELTRWLAPRYGDDLSLEHDLDRVPELEPRRKTYRASVYDALEKGVIDSDEAREELGYGPRADDAVEKLDPKILKELREGADIWGLEPLARYMKSVSLFPPNASIEDIVSAALDTIESREPDDHDENTGEGADNEEVEQDED